MHSESKRYDFERLYIDCQPRLTAYALRFVNNPIEAQDLVHDCFMALWDRQAPLDTEEARMLLFAMTRNRCLNYLKHKSIVDKYTVSYLARAKVGGGASLQLRFLLRRERASPTCTRSWNSRYSASWIRCPNAAAKCFSSPGSRG